MPSPNLPNALLKFGLALAKHYVKKVIGDEAMQEIATAATDLTGEEVKAKVDFILGNKDGEKQLLKAARTADQSFKKKCQDKKFLELFAMDHGDLPSIQTAIANLPKELDDEALQATLFKVFRAELPKRISDRQVDDGVNLYVKCLQDALLPVKDFGLRILHNELKEIGKDVKDVKAGVDFLVKNAKTASQSTDNSKNYTRFHVPFHHNSIIEGINFLPYDYDQRIQNFLTEYLGTDSHPVPFGGRDDALNMLDTWLSETTPYLLLAAPAGCGKSALLVRWLENLKARDDLALAFVPVSIRFGTNTERVFYAALAARLAFLHGDDTLVSPETPTAVYRGLVSDYLSKPLAHGRTLLVVLDGLDEAADWQAGADFMPGELPAGVRLVVSARFLAGDADSTAWLRRLNWERNGLASARGLNPLDQEGVRDVLFKMVWPLNELSRKIDIVAELFHLSEGDPLLVGLYVGDLWKKGDEAARLKPEDLAGIEPSYNGYFNKWWEDQEKLWGTDTPLMRPNVQMLLNLLACALSGLTREDLFRLAPQELNRYTLDNAFKALQRFVVGDGVIQGYTFSHPKLGQYFWDALTKSEKAMIKGHFLKAGDFFCEHIGRWDSQQLYFNYEKIVTLSDVQTGLLSIKHYFSAGEYSKAQNVLESIADGFSLLGNEMLFLEWLNRLFKVAELTPWLKLYLCIFTLEGKSKYALLDVDQVLESLAACPDRKLASVALVRLAQVRTMSNMFDSAEELLYESWEIKKSLVPPDHKGIAHVVNELARLSLARPGCSPETALEWHRRALEIQENISDARGESYTIRKMASIYLYRLKNILEASNLLQKSKHLSEIVGDKAGLVQILSEEAEIQCRLQRYGDAVETLRQASNIAIENGDMFGNASALRQLGRVYESVELYGDALKWSNKSKEILQEIVGMDTGELLTVEKQLTRIHKRLSLLTEELENLNLKLKQLEEKRNLIDNEADMDSLKSEIRIITRKSKRIRQRLGIEKGLIRLRPLEKNNNKS